ncbi:hypothetical protein COY07_01360 [Candidatus Peregrinibacteria bacterium CG_4_10_14_0_2_um_filter_43_11]|nr:MAG: hypothetical protein COY07_01360 [Candidatus Peregrinibacteria bacterium CG_4_10_14_0_2_um_filter_43_11]
MGIGGPGEGWGITPERPRQSPESIRLEIRSKQARREKAEPINKIHAILSQKSADLLTAEERQILEIVEKARAQMHHCNR